MESSEHPLENLRSIERKIDGLQDFKLKFGQIEEALTKLQVSISSQTVLLEAVQAQVGLKGTSTEEVQLKAANLTKGTFASQCTVVTPPTIPPLSILKKITVQTVDLGACSAREAEDVVPLPNQSPNTFPVVPDPQVMKERRLSVTSQDKSRSPPSPGFRTNPDAEGRRPSLFSHRSSGQSDGRRKNALLEEQPSSVDELSLKTTRKLLRGFSALSEPGRLKTSSPYSTKTTVLENMRNMSLDELRTNHNALVATQSVRNLDLELEEQGGMPFTAELLLVFTGILKSWSPRLLMFWVSCLLVLFLGSSGALAWFSGVAGLLEADITITSVSYMAGIAASIWMLRRTDIQELLKDDESSLDSYARQAGFIKQWRQKSRKRFIEAIGCLVLICASRCLVYVQVPVSLHDLVLTSAYCFASVAFVAVAYLQLHVLKGLELAIDSFSVQFFRDMDFEKALNEWNVLQALLRHVSTKLSGSLLMLGFSSGVSILYLIELSFVRTDVLGGFQFILQNLWSLPPIMMWLYTLSRAAAVTEKASRVSPLVNSWTFDSEEVEEEYEWMDLTRQYLVQYISQSEAGFYMQGVRIRIFQVSKMCYYLGAVLFAVVSQMTA